MGAPAAVHGEAGFTLPELLLAMAITTTIFLAAAMTLIVGIRTVSPKAGENPNADPRMVSARRIDQASALALAVPGDVHGVVPEAIVTDGSTACEPVPGSVALLSVTTPGASGSWRAADYAVVANAGSPTLSDLVRTSCTGDALAVDPPGERSTLARYLAGSRAVVRDLGGARTQVAGVEHAVGADHLSVWVDADGPGPGARTTVSAWTQVDPVPTTTTSTTAVPTTTTTVPLTTTSTTVPETGSTTTSSTIVLGTTTTTEVVP